MQQRLTCHHCRANVPAGRFCSACGAPQPGIVCAGCRATLAAGAGFCDQCGTRVGIGYPPAPVVWFPPQPPAQSSRKLAPAGVALVVMTAIILAVIAAWPGESDGHSQASLNEDWRPAIWETGMDAGTPVPGTYAFEPYEIIDDLADLGVRAAEEPRGGKCTIDEPLRYSADGVVGYVGQYCDYGVIEYWVYETDVAAAEAVLANRSSLAFPLKTYPWYPTDLYMDWDNSFVFAVAVGNVVVVGYTPPDWVDLPESDAAELNTPHGAADLAVLGVKRLIRIGGFEPRPVGHVA